MTTRAAAVAGAFYPADASALQQAVSHYLDQVSQSESSSKAIIAPHAGYVYSAPVAAHAYQRIPRTRVTRVVLLGPAHYVFLRGMALPSVANFATPLGQIPIDREAVAAVEHLPQVVIMDEAHAEEHCLEVHLPFLQQILGSFELVPFVVGETTPEEVCEVLDTLWGGDETLILVSSDLSHYHDYQTARRIDAQTTSAIERFEIANIGPEDACGCRAVNGLLRIAQQRGMHIETLEVANSGDTAGPRDAVVGYGAYAVNLPE